MRLSDFGFFFAVLLTRHEPVLLLFFQRLNKTFSSSLAKHSVVVLGGERRHDLVLRSGFLGFFGPPLREPWCCDSGGICRC